MLFVCTGNICRSPIAEQVFAATFGDPVVVFSSAGTAAMLGHPMPDQARTISKRLGGEERHHEPRLLDTSLVEEADLVVALSREHRADIVRLVPRSSRYTFTLRELARLLESLDSSDGPTPEGLSGEGLVERLRAAVSLVASQRGFAEAPADAIDDDVIDPYGQPDPTYDLAGEQIKDAVDRIAEAVTRLAGRSR